MKERIPFSKPDQPSWHDNNKMEWKGGLEKAWRQATFVVGDRPFKEVLITGVAHTLDTFEMHREDIEKAVKESSVVFLEGYATRDVRETIPEDFPREKDIAAFRAQLQELKKSGVHLPVEPGAVTDEMIRRELILYHDSAHLAQTDFYQFYDKVKALAALYKKPIAFADPMESVIARGKERIAKGKETAGAAGDTLEFSTEEKNIRESVLYGGLVAGGVALFLSQFAPKSKNAPVSRRSFLRLAGAGAAAAALGGASALSEKMEYVSERHGWWLDRDTNPLGAFRYNAITDYREIAAGLAIQRLAELTKEEKNPIAVFFGRAHFGSIEHYATSPIEARIRLRAYPQQLAYAAPELALYEFDDAKSEWVLRRKESLLDE
jgi:hypothetical protein